MAFAAMLAATGASALSKYKQGQYGDAMATAQAHAVEADAQGFEHEAEAAKQRTIFDQVRALGAGRRAMGTLRSGLGASGAMLTTGAPSKLVAEQGFENALNVALIGHRGQTQMSKLKSAASRSRYQGKIYRMQAKSAKRAGTIGAVTSLLSGFGTMAGMGMFGGGGAASTVGGQGSSINISGSRFSNPMAVFGSP